MLKKSFFMNGSDTVLPTAQVRALHALAAGALTTSETRSREPSGPAGETGVSAVAVWMTAPLKRADAPSHQPHVEQVPS